MEGWTAGGGAWGRVVGGRGVELRRARGDASCPRVLRPPGAPGSGRLSGPAAGWLGRHWPSARLRQERGLLARGRVAQGGPE